MRIGENKTRSFSYSIGAREGSILNPLLCHVYINNLLYLLLSDPFVLPNETKINSLLYADDLISYPIEVQNWITKLFKHALFIF